MKDNVYTNIRVFFTTYDYDISVSIFEVHDKSGSEAHKHPPSFENINYLKISYHSRLSGHHLRV